MSVKNELSVLEQLRAVVDAGINPTENEPVQDETLDEEVLDEELTDETPSADPEPEPEPAEVIPVLIDFPSVDQMPAANTVFMLPDYAEYESLATVNDRAEFRVNIWILCKRAPRADLTTKVYGIYNQIYELLRKDTDLGGYVDFCEVRSADFYPAVEMNKNVQGIEMSLAIQYTKDWL